MCVKRLQLPNKSTNPIDNFRIKKIEENGLNDPKISQQPYIIIENNLEVIEQLQNLLQQILEISEEGLDTESFEDKNKALQNIRDKIMQQSTKE